MWRLLALLVVFCSVSVEFRTSVAVNSSDRTENMPHLLSPPLLQRAMLAFRSMDLNSDGRVSRDEISNDRSKHLPSLSADEFVSFLEVADSNADRVLSEQEFSKALAHGLRTQTNFIELSAANSASSQRGYPRRPWPIHVKGKEYDPYWKLEKPTVFTVQDDDEEHAKVKPHAGHAEEAKETKKPWGEGRNWNDDEEEGQVAQNYQALNVEDKYRVDLKEDACIACQYIMERISNNIHWSGVLPETKAGRPDRTGRDPFTLAGRYNERISHPEVRGMIADTQRLQRDRWARLGLNSDPTKAGTPQAFIEEDGDVRNEELPLDDELSLGSFLELEFQASSRSQERSTAKSQASQFPAHQNTFPFGAPLTYGSTPYGPFQTLSGNQPDYRQYFNALERQKFSEVYHVADLTLDHVCEQRMPNDFYKHCKRIYDEQGLIVNLFTRQFGTQSICSRIEMCRPVSYIKRAIHTPRLFHEPRHR